MEAGLVYLMAGHGRIACPAFVLFAAAAGLADGQGVIISISGPREPHVCGQTHSLQSSLIVLRAGGFKLDRLNELSKRITFNC